MIRRSSAAAAAHLDQRRRHRRQHHRRGSAPALLAALPWHSVVHGTRRHGPTTSAVPPTPPGSTGAEAQPPHASPPRVPRECSLCHQGFTDWQAQAQELELCTVCFEFCCRDCLAHLRHIPAPRYPGPTHCATQGAQDCWEKTTGVNAWVETGLFTPGEGEPVAVGQHFAEAVDTIAASSTTASTATALAATMTREERRRAADRAWQALPETLRATFQQRHTRNLLKFIRRSRDHDKRRSAERWRRTCAACGGFLCPQCFCATCSAMEGCDAEFCRDCAILGRRCVGADTGGGNGSSYHVEVDALPGGRDLVVIHDSDSSADACMSDASKGGTTEEHDATTRQRLDVHVHACRPPRAPRRHRQRPGKLRQPEVIVLDDD